MLDLTDYPLISIFLVSLGVMVVASELGRLLGKRTGNHGGENVSTLEGAVLGLLALMIGFTFAMALARFESRRDGVLSEANAIGTTALRARLLPAPHNEEVLRLLQSYVQVRLEITQRVPTQGQLDIAIKRSNALQEELWQQAIAMAAIDKELVPTGLFIQALNDLIDNHERRLTALRSQVPNSVVLALYGVATISSAFAGYASGLGSRPSRLPVYVIVLLVCMVILLIQDLDRPSTGFITVSQQPMVDAAASIAGYIH